MNQMNQQTITTEAGLVLVNGHLDWIELALLVGGGFGAGLHFKISPAEACMVAGHNALFFKTPDNSFEQNLLALQSLQKRLREISDMDVRSFEYQQAIAQITAQEQGEAQAVLSVIGGCWLLENHFFLWRWLVITQECVLFVLWILTVVIVAD